ncbi:MAG: hypothetical protein F4179_01120 [Gammaproteobacteria bacterium]|nr:hypothetical protein [Gammaproteobacteria bacterium]
MLRDSDLTVFVDLVRQAERKPAQLPDACPDSILRTETRSADLLHRNDCARLWRSLKIACAVGDVPKSCHRILNVIVRSLKAEDYCYLPLTRMEEWSRAICWAIQRVGPSKTVLPHTGPDRQSVVGSACQRLREAGYNVAVSAWGPQFDPDTRLAIAERLDSLVAEVGGVPFIRELCRFVRVTGNVHDGMWLLGDRPRGYDNALKPAIPIAWLLAIALRHVHRTPRPRKSAEAWEMAIGLATDFAACMDCQRYNRFDGLHLDVPDFLPEMQDALKWRELFTLPQVPPRAIATLRSAFCQVTWPRGTRSLRNDIDGLFAEVELLLADLPVDGIVAMPQTALSAFPLLRLHAGTHKDSDAEYLDPFGAHPRKHERYVFFETDDDEVVVLPSSLTAAAACEAIFRLIWHRAGRNSAADLVGQVLEKAVAIACKRRSKSVWEKVVYDAAGERLEIDVAVRENQQIVLFETKAKSLTSEARLGDVMTFIDDYTKSFLTLVTQLVRHDRNIRRGLTPLVEKDAIPRDLHITKVAVSPLSYGPASDQVLQNALLHSMIRARLGSVKKDPQHIRILTAFNDTIAQIARMADLIAITRNGEIDLVRYFIQLSWVDLGQLLYMLHRGHSVSSAVSALRHVTFSTRDFWTEVALADRNGLTKTKWRQVIGGTN